MMRTLWLLVLMVGCSNGGPLWQECETASDCPAGYGCSFHNAETPGYCLLACEADAECSDYFGDVGPDSAARCSPGLTCEEPCGRGCFLTGCNDDSDCAGARCVGGNCRP